MDEPCLMNREAVDIQFELISLQEIIKFMEKMLDQPVGRSAFCSFFASSDLPKLAVVLLSLATPNLPPTYASNTLR